MNLSPNVQLSPIGLPKKKQLGNLIFSLIPRLASIKIQPSNVSQIASATLTTGALTASAGSGTTGIELQFPVQKLIFNLRSGASPSQFIDSRFSTLNFRCQIDTTTAPSSAISNLE